MKQYKKYRIFLNGRQVTEEEIYKHADNLAGDDPYHLKQMKAESLLEIKKESLPLQEEIQYERLVENHLVTIENTHIGKLLLNSLSPHFKVFIINKREEYYDNCGCYASTSGPLPKEAGGHIRISYTPSFLSKALRSDYEDILAHELFHAYHRSLKSTNYKIPDYGRIEEIYAILMQNIYLASKGNVSLCKSNKNQKFHHKKELDEWLSTSSLALNTVKYYMEDVKDPLAKQVAKWCYPSFNPWRDYPIYYKKFYEKQKQNEVRFGSQKYLTTKIDL